MANNTNNTNYIGPFIPIFSCEHFENKGPDRKYKYCTAEKLLVITQIILLLCLTF